ncbi:hypothetical protein NDN08_005816 [Rhodosorus marinus]|uniref:Uncharacterized protein n=1 Tax=Rhodosorus marinus TaxID=101924 RepID=A0AAV8V4D5_9RHOD|nr:hypothetical protein NDN08_005816 [Rhodosorus marinus]
MHLSGWFGNGITQGRPLLMKAADGSIHTMSCEQLFKLGRNKRDVGMDEDGEEYVCEQVDIEGWKTLSSRDETPPLKPLWSDVRSMLKSKRNLLHITFGSSHGEVVALPQTRVCSTEGDVDLHTGVRSGLKHLVRIKPPPLSNESLPALDLGSAIRKSSSLLNYQQGSSTPLDISTSAQALRLSYQGSLVPAPFEVNRHYPTDSYKIRILLKLSALLLCRFQLRWDCRKFRITPQLGLSDPGAQIRDLYESLQSIILSPSARAEIEVVQKGSIMFESRELAAFLRMLTGWDFQGPILSNSAVTGIPSFVFSLALADQVFFFDFFSEQLISNVRNPLIAAGISYHYGQRESECEFIMEKSSGCAVLPPQFAEKVSRRQLAPVETWSFETYHCNSTYSLDVDNNWYADGMGLTALRGMDLRKGFTKPKLRNPRVNKWNYDRPKAKTLARTRRRPL